MHTDLKFTQGGAKLSGMLSGIATPCGASASRCVLPEPLVRSFDTCMREHLLYRARLPRLLTFVAARHALSLPYVRLKHVSAVRPRMSAVKRPVSQHCC